MTDEGLYADDLALGLVLADVADAVTLARFQALDLVVETKPDLTPVSDADTADGAGPARAPGRARPGDVVLGEEYGGAARDVGAPGSLDPIDGTKNFVRGCPSGRRSSRCSTTGCPSSGWCRRLRSARRWWAATGAGAWGSAPGSRRDGRLRVSEVARLEDASVSYSDLAELGRPAPAFDALLAIAWRSRAYGDFWSHVLVAEGAVDLAAEPELALWDVAALIPVVREAGGRVTGCDGGPCTGAAGALTTNGALHDAALHALDPR